MATSIGNAAFYTVSGFHRQKMDAFRLVFFNRFEFICKRISHFFATLQPNKDNRSFAKVGGRKSKTLMNMV